MRRWLIMRAFEIHLNGEKLCVAGLETGTLLFSVACEENKQGRSGVGLNMTGTLLALETVRWQHRGLRMNDEILVKIVEITKADKYKTMQKPPSDERKYEKAYVRRMANEFGWTIQRGPRRKKTAAARRGT
jgi:Txe/YoeB family toxin of Txe-Axe toxin-antitoxin module